MAFVNISLTLHVIWNGKSHNQETLRKLKRNQKKNEFKTKAETQWLKTKTTCRDPG